jgi:hypothetical protein
MTETNATAGIVPLHMHVLHALAENGNTQTRDSLIPGLVSASVSVNYDVTLETVDAAIQQLMDEKLVTKVGENKGLPVIKIADEGKSKLGPMMETSTPWAGPGGPENHEGHTVTL